jgi:hypothetical protein
MKNKRLLIPAFSSIGDGGEEENSNRHCPATRLVIFGIKA